MTYTPENKYFYSETEYLHYRTIGEGSRKILFLHGFGASSRTWDDVIPGLGVRNSQLVLLDLIGFGFSSKPEGGDYSMEANAGVVAKFIKENGFEDYVMVGHSFGGGVALLSTMKLIDDYAHQPEALILIDAAACETDLPFFIGNLRIPFLGKIFMSLTSPEFQARYTLKKIYFDKNKVTENLVSRYAFFMSLEGHDNAMIQTAKQIIPKDFRKYTDRYTTMDMPVLVLWGRHDPTIPLQCARKLENEFPRAALSIIDECGHIPQEEQPGETARLVSSFVKGLGTR